MCLITNESAPKVFTGISGELQSQHALSSNTASRVMWMRLVAGSKAR
jgi:hypothetical protein